MNQPNRSNPNSSQVGRGSSLRPQNRFESRSIEMLLEELEELDDQDSTTQRKLPTEFLEDSSQSIVSQNNSPDLKFRYSLNPYRGCEHGCSYCYARPTHEYLGFDSGLDFESKIIVKKNAAKLLRKFLAKPSWQVEPIAFSGVTDCYQPAEREFKLTRQCLKVAAECNQPLSIVTKNALVLRDLDLLQPMAAMNLVRVYVSVTTLDSKLARQMEPRTSSPAARIRTIETLVDAGIPTGAMIAPVIPGLNDSEIPEIMKTISSAGAQVAGFVLLRLPLNVLPVFEDWLNRTRPDQAAKILNRIRQTRGGQLNDSSFGQRMTGQGEIANQIRTMFRTFRTQHGLEQQFAPHNCGDFIRPSKTPGQQKLF